MSCWIFDHISLKKDLMKAVQVLLAAALGLCACSDKPPAGALPPDTPESVSTQPTLRLVGQFSFHDKLSMSKPDGTPVSTRQMTMQGSFNQLVTVEAVDDGELRIRPLDGQSIDLKGKVTEQGDFASADPESNSIVKMVGSSKFAGTLDEDFDLSVKRSPYGQGDDILLTVRGKLQGQESIEATMNNGHTMALPDGSGAAMMISLLETDPSDPAKRHFSMTWLLPPVLATRPSEPGTQQMFYDNIKANPTAFHHGLVTSPDRRSWTYQRTINRTDPSKQDQDIAWTETFTLKLHLEKP
jgi:hypothetical protein